MIGFSEAYGCSWIGRIVWSIIGAFIGFLATKIYYAKDEEVKSMKEREELRMKHEEETE